MGDGKKDPVTYKVYFTKRCEERFRKIQPSIKKMIGRTVDELSVNPRLGYSLKDPVLRNLYSIHAHDYRIVYKFTDNPAEVEIWAIEHRKHVYEELMRYRSSSC